MPSNRRFRYVVLGAGPGGLQMAYFLAQKGRDYVVLERNTRAGSFFEQHPRHRTLLSINKRHNFFGEADFNMRHDWNSLLSDDPAMRFTEYSEELFPHADALCRYLQDFAARFQLNIHYDTEVKRIEGGGDGRFVLRADGGSAYECDILLSGLGCVAPWVPEEIDGIEFATPYEEHSLDLELYRNKRVAIIGQGNSAFETAEHLSESAAMVHILAKSPVRFAWDTHHVGDLRAINNNVFDMYQLKSLHAVLTPRLKAIRRLPGGTLETSHEYDYPKADPPGSLRLTREYDHIIHCAGWKWFPEGLFDHQVQPESRHDGKYLSLLPDWESTNVPDLFFIGGAMRSNDDKAASGFIHGFRYNIRTLHHLLEERYEGVEYPRATHDPFNLPKLLDWLYERLSVSDALFQMYGVLCDVVSFETDMNSAEILQELPLDIALDRDYEGRHALVVTLEFGFDRFDEPSVTFFGPSDPTDTSCAAFLHPVIRHIHEGVTSEFHFGDSLLARWDRPHGEGGAVVSYHYKFQRWLVDKLGIDVELPAPSPGGPFHPWSADEVEAWNARQSQKVRSAPCERPF